jgi:hypothetical protein
MTAITPDAVVIVLADVAAGVPVSWHEAAASAARTRMAGRVQVCHPFPAVPFSRSSRAKSRDLAV